MELKERINKKVAVIAVMITMLVIAPFGKIYAQAATAPTTVSVQQLGYANVKIVWNPGYGCSFYELYMSTSPNGSYQLITTTTNTSYQTSALTVGRTYYFKVRSGDGYGHAITYSNFTNPVSHTCYFIK